MKHTALEAHEFVKLTFFLSSLIFMTLLNSLLFIQPTSTHNVGKFTAFSNSTNVNLHFSNSTNSNSWLYETHLFNQLSQSQLMTLSNSPLFPTHIAHGFVKAILKWAMHCQIHTFSNTSSQSLSGDALSPFIKITYLLPSNLSNSFSTSY